MILPIEDLGYYPEENGKPFSGITTSNTNIHGETVLTKGEKIMPACKNVDKKIVVPL